MPRNRNNQPADADTAEVDADDAAAEIAAEVDATEPAADATPLLTSLADEAADTAAKPKTRKSKRARGEGRAPSKFALFIGWFKATMPAGRDYDAKVIVTTWCRGSAKHKVPAHYPVIPGKRDTPEATIFSGLYTSRTAGELAKVGVTFTPERERTDSGSGPTLRHD